MSLHDRAQRVPCVQARNRQPISEQMVTGWISRNCSERDSRPDRKVLVWRSNQSVRSQMEARVRVHIRRAHDVEVGRCLVHGVTDGGVQGNDAQNCGACMK